MPIARPDCLPIPTKCIAWTIRENIFSIARPVYRASVGAQGHPVVIQAGQSGRGTTFAALWAECVFVAYHGIERAKTDYATFKAKVEAAGRDPEKVHVCAGVYPVVAATRAEAEDKVALIDKLPKEIDSLSLLSEVLNFDFSQQPIDKPFTQEQLDSWTGVRGIHDRMKRELGNRLPSPRDFIDITQRSDAPSTTTRALLAVRKDVADGLGGMVHRPRLRWVCRCRLAHSRALTRSSSQFVVPELQRRGLHHLDYKGPTLRENLGLDRTACGRSLAQICPLTKENSSDEIVVCPWRLLDRHSCADGGTWAKPYEGVAVSLREGAQFKPDFTSVNPKSKVPTLVDDEGTVRTEFPAIAYWLARTNPFANLLPDNIDLQARALELMDYCVATIHMQGFARIFRAPNFAPSALGRASGQGTRH